eukprot:Skav232161  [mRNA]  locus=scaffold1040:499989:500279:+ [translate_table: standard]
MNEMPDENSDPTISALIDLGGFDDLLLQRRRDPPIHHVARVLVLIGAGYEAGIMWSQAGCEHPCAPWPPGLHQAVLAIRELHDIQASMVRLLLTWV